MSSASELADLESRFGTGVRRSTSTHQRPAGMDDATVDALGRLSAALETAEDARGHLYAFHRLSGRADLDLDDAIAALRAAEHVARDQFNAPPHLAEAEMKAREQGSTEQ